MYNSSAYKNKKFKCGYTKQQLNDAKDKQEKEAKFEQILEDFVPAMRATNIPTAFVWQLIDLHKSEFSSGLNATGEDLGKPSQMQEKDRFNGGLTEKLNKVELLKYFNSLEESFVKFARTHIMFKCLCEKDQLELLKRNSILFVMVRSVAYRTPPLLYLSSI